MLMPRTLHDVWWTPVLFSDDELLTPPPPRERLSYTRYQLELLNGIYISVRYPNSVQKQLIAKRVGISREQVKVSRLLFLCLPHSPPPPPPFPIVLSPLHVCLLFSVVLVLFVSFSFFKKEEVYLAFVGFGVCMCVCVCVCVCVYLRLLLLLLLFFFFSSIAVFSQWLYETCHSHRSQCSQL